MGDKRVGGADCECGSMGLWDECGMMGGRKRKPCKPREKDGLGGERRAPSRRDDGACLVQQDHN